MDFGGIERGVYDFSLAASELGHIVVVASGNGRFLPFLTEKGIRWHDLPMEKKTLPVFFKSCRMLKKIIHSEKPDIIHVQSRFPCWVASFVMKSFPEVPWVTSIHSFNKLRWYSRSDGKGNRVITVSNALKKHAIEYLGIPEEKIRVVYNGVSDDFLKIDKARNAVPVVGMIARFRPYKGHFFFLDAFKKLHADGINANALIIGSGNQSYRRKLECGANERGLSGKVKIARMDAKDALRIIDILVVPSLEPEGFGRTVVEAQMSKTPVIGTNIGAIPELIDDGKTGFLVEPGDSGQLAEKIRLIIQNPLDAARIADAAKKNAAEKFTLGAMVKKHLDVYGELTIR